MSILWTATEFVASTPGTYGTMTTTPVTIHA